MTVRRATRALLAFGVVVLTCPIPGTANAQDAAAVRLTLRAQTPWTTSTSPVLRVEVLASNDSAAAFEDLSLELAIGLPFVSRFGYETALTEGPSTVVASSVVPLDGALGAGQARIFVARVDIGTWPAVNPDDSKVYPLRVRLLAGGAPIGELESTEIHLARTPEAPMLFSWWLELAAPPAFDPDGRLADPTLEAALDADGALAAPLEAVHRVLLSAGAPPAIDLVVQPSLLTDLEEMADGYSRSDGTEVSAGTGGAAAAADFLDALRAAAAAPSVEVIALPYAAPVIPSLLRSGLEGEARAQLLEGSAVTRTILDVAPSTDVARPVDGLMDPATLSWYVTAGRTTILADADEVERSVQALAFAPAPTAAVTVRPGTQTTLILPDPSTDALLRRADLLADPLRAAQAALGEVAVIWKEEPNPSPPEQRGIALALPSSLPPQMWQPLLSRLGTAPFLRPVHPIDLASGVYPPGVATSLADAETPAFSAQYARTIEGLRGDVDAFASMLVEPSTVPDRLRASLLTAESKTYLGNEAAGGRWLDAVAVVCRRAFDSTTPEVPQLFTFTSRDGAIPLQLGDPGNVSLRVRIRLQSSQFDFPEGSERTVILDRPNRIVTFRVVAKASGRHPITVVVLSPSGRPIRQLTIIVGTTAVNGIAVVVTAIAALGLLALYVRRWVRRRSR